MNDKMMDCVYTTFDSQEVTCTTGKVNWNLEKVHELLDEQLEKNWDDVVDDKNIKDGKKFVAKLRKEMNRLQTVRKQIKNQILNEYNEFEADVKSIDNKVSEIENNIRQQIKRIEEREKEEKFRKIKHEYGMRLSHFELTTNKSEFASFNDFYQGNMVNKTYSFTQIEKDLNEYFEKIKNDLEQLDNIALLSDISLEDLQDTYKQTHNVNETISIHKSAKQEEVIDKFVQVRIELRESDLLKLYKLDWVNVIQQYK